MLDSQPKLYVSYIIRNAAVPDLFGNKNNSRKLHIWQNTCLGEEKKKKSAILTHT